MTEDKLHLMICLNQYCKEKWESNVTIVEEWMEQQDTHAGDSRMHGLSTESEVCDLGLLHKL